MLKRMRYKKVPFDNLGKSLFSFLSGELLCIWIIGISSLVFLPEIIPMKFNWSGLPTGWGLNATLVIMALLFSIVPVVVLLITLFRFKLMNRSLRIINAPAFYTNMGSLSPARRGYWVNEYFKIVLVAGIYISCILLTIILEVYAAANKFYLNGFLAVVVSVVWVVAVAVLLLLLIKNMYVRMDKEISGRKRPGRR